MGPVYVVAILGTLLIPLSYFLIRRVLPQFVALTTSFLLAFNVIAIQLSRFSWNPNIAPFFSLIWLYSLWMTQIGKLKYWFLVALSVAILAQLHYVTLIVLVPSLFVWMQQLFKYRKEKTQIKSFLFVTLISAFILILSTLPLILFDLKNGGINVRAFASIIHGDDAFAVDQEKTERVVQIIGQTRARSAHVMTELFFGQQQSIGVLLAFTVLVALALSIYNERNKKIYSAISVALITVLVSIIALSIYKNDVYNHYIAFLIPVICLLYAYLLYKIWLMGRSNKIVVLAFLLFYFVGSLGQISFQPNGPSLNQLRKTANAIHELIAPNEIYALLLLSQTKDTYGMNYRYYASLIRDKKPIGPEFLDQASSMIVIQEDRELDNPLSLPLYELLVFNVATPSAQIEIENGPIIYKLEKIRSETNQN
jgi:4-amino-4-deoxy-L-arabinose transferase-like glycosyltransferase